MMSLGARLGLFSLLCAVPAIFLLGQLLTFNLGANPAEALIDSTGEWALYFLFLTLAITPIQKFLQPKWPIPMSLIRRVLGLSAFAFVLLHLSSYAAFDMGFDLASILADIIERPFILLGFSAFLLLIPLVITSTQNWQKHLKSKWQRLHQLVYLITALGLIHYILLTRADWFMPALYLMIFVILMLPRVMDWHKKAGRKSTGR